MIKWKMDPTKHFTDVTDLRLRESMGLVPLMLPGFHPAAEEIQHNYIHGGGYMPFDGFSMEEDGTLTYPDDPDMYPVAEAINEFKETVRFYEHAWVSITQPDGSFAVTRMD